MEKEFALDEINAAAAWLLQNENAKKVFAFYGEMGAGKTTFIHALCAAFKVQDVVTSPTFSIINEYRYENNGTATIYHMDLYRIKDEEDAVRAGVEDCLYSGHYCFVEWPEKAPDLFPDDTLYVTIAVLDNQKRKLEILRK